MKTKDQLVDEAEDSVRKIYAAVDDIQQGLAAIAKAKGGFEIIDGIVTGQQLAERLNQPIALLARGCREIISSQLAKIDQLTKERDEARAIADKYDSQLQEIHDIAAGEEITDEEDEQESDPQPAYAGTAGQSFQTELANALKSKATAPGECELCGGAHETPDAYSRIKELVGEIVASR